MGDHYVSKFPLTSVPGHYFKNTSIMKAFIAVLAVLSYSAFVSTFELVSSATAGLSVPLLAVGGASAGTTAATVIPTITAIAGGAITLKALGLLLSSTGRSKRATSDEDGLTFAFIAQSEPQACYRRLICDLATGQLPKSENDVIVSLFDGKKADVTSAKFDFDTAAEVGKALKNVDACEIRYSCPFKGEQIVKLIS